MQVVALHSSLLFASNSKGIFHRDIKPENILVRGDVHSVPLPFPNASPSSPYHLTSSFPIVKLADFGSCRGIHSKMPYTEYIATRWYRSPECLLFDGIYTYKMDVWGIGCVFFELITKVPLFPGDDELDQLHKIHHVLGSPSEKLMKNMVTSGQNMLVNGVINGGKENTNNVTGSAAVTTGASGVKPPKGIFKKQYAFPTSKGVGLRAIVPAHILHGAAKVNSSKHGAGYNATDYPGLSDECMNLVEQLLQYDPDARPSARHALKHPWLKECRDAEAREKAATTVQAPAAANEAPTVASENLALQKKVPPANAAIASSSKDATVSTTATIDPLKAPIKRRTKQPSSTSVDNSASDANRTKNVAVQMPVIASSSTTNATTTSLRKDAGIMQTVIKGLHAISFTDSGKQNKVSEAAAAKKREDEQTTSLTKASMKLASSVSSPTKNSVGPLSIGKTVSVQSNAAPPTFTQLSPVHETHKTTTGAGATTATLSPIKERESRKAAASGVAPMMKRQAQPAVTSLSGFAITNTLPSINLHGKQAVPSISTGTTTVTVSVGATIVTATPAPVASFVKPVLKPVVGKQASSDTEHHNGTSPTNNIPVAIHKPTIVTAPLTSAAPDKYTDANQEGYSPATLVLDKTKPHISVEPLEQGKGEEALESKIVANSLRLNHHESNARASPAAAAIEPGETTTVSVEAKASPAYVVESVLPATTRLNALRSTVPTDPLQPEMADQIPVALPLPMPITSGEETSTAVPLSTGPSEPVDSSDVTPPLVDAAHEHVV